jgi:uncharacterized protein YhjY with autotransporter beta-barrel domain/mono/diheme cytochrome c family protein
MVFPSGYLQSPPLAERGSTLFLQFKSNSVWSKIAGFSLYRLMALFVFFVTPTAVNAQTAAQLGETLWNAQCASCHAATTRPLHAANSTAVLTGVYTNNMNGGAPTLNPTQQTQIVAYLGSQLGAPLSFTVPYNAGSAPATSFTVPGLTPGGAHTTFANVSAVNRNGAAISFTPASAQGSYTAAVGQCSDTTFTYRGDGAVGGRPAAVNTTERTANVAITPPTAPSAANSSSTIVYSTLATSIPLSLSGTPATSITITQQPSVGSVSVSGLAVSYMASNTAFTSPVTFKYRAAGPCSTLSSEATVTLTISSLPAPVITSALTANGTGGQTFTYQITANNAPTSFNVSGALPPGLAFNGTSTISGTPTAPGSFPITVSATNATGTTNQATTITIGSAIPGVNSVPTANGTSGQTFSYQITATNLPTSFGVTGTLPTNLSVNTTTGLISGSLLVASSGIFNVTITATNSAGTGSLPLAISVSLNAPTVTSAGTANGTVGQVFSYQVMGSDFPTSYAATGLPAGLSLNTTTGLLSGTPTVQGTFNATVSAINGAGTSAARPVVITIVLLAPVISSSTSASGTVGVPLSYQITASSTPVSFSATGLPPGLSINTTTGLISGAPSAVGTFTATVNATNATGTGSATVTFSIANVPLPGVGGLNVSTAFNTPVAINLASVVSGNFTSVAIATQPANGTVVLNGLNATYTPKPGFFGTDSFGYAATGQGGTSAPATVTINVATPPVPLLTTLTVSVPFNKPGTIDLASGIAGIFTSITIVTGPTQGTAALNGTTLSYTPNKGYFGADSFTFTATGPGGTSAVGTVNITVSTQPPLADGLSFILPLNTPTTLDLAPFISGSAISGVRVVKQPAHGEVSVNGTKITFTPKTDFFGADTFTYAAFGNAGTSPAATVKVTVTGRPDPTKQAAVAGLAAAQAETAERFAKAQISNFQSRMESRHRVDDLIKPVKPGGKDGATGIAAADQPEKPRAGNFLSNSYAAASAKDIDPLGSKAAADSFPSAFPFSSDLASLLASGSLNVASLVASASGAPAGAVGKTGPNFWIAGTANFGLRQANSQRSSLDFSTSGISLGVDQRINEQLLLGVGAGFARDKTEIGNDGSNSRATGYSGVVYASFQPTPQTFIDGLIGAGSLDFKTKRYVSVIDQFATGKRSGVQIFGSIAAGYEYRNNGVLLSPYGRFDFSSNKLRQSGENGAGQYALTYFGQTTTSLQGVAGVRAESSHDTSFGTATPRLRLEYRREFKGSSDGSVGYADLAGSALDSQRYGFSTEPVARNALAFGFGADFIRREGFKVGLDYELLHTFNRDSNQSIRLSFTQDLDGRAGALAWLATKPKDVQVDAGYTFDGNVTRAKESDNKRVDRATSLNASRVLTYKSDNYPNFRVLVTYSGGAEKFQNFDGLSRASAGLQGELQYRPSGNFDAATFSLTAQVTGEYFRSVLRRGVRSSIAGSVRLPVTDRVSVSAALAHNERQARSDVFTSRDNGARFGVDYAFSASDTIYLNGEFRKGHFVSTGKASLENLAIADVFVFDDAFLGADFLTYRTKGKTVLSTLGYNLGLGERHSVDLSWRRILSTPDFRPDFVTSPRSYVVDQYSLVYLMRF